LFVFLIEVFFTGAFFAGAFFEAAFFAGTFFAGAFFAVVPVWSTSVNFIVATSFLTVITFDVIAPDATEVVGLEISGVADVSTIVESLGVKVSVGACILTFASINKPDVDFVVSISFPKKNSETFFHKDFNFSMIFFIINSYIKPKIMKTTIAKKRVENVEKLNIWQKISLFLRNLRKAPAKSGQRRLIQNLTTGKWEWTEGDAPLLTTVDSLSSDKFNTSNNGELLKGKERERDNLSAAIKFTPYEPYKKNRWLLEFPGIDPYFFTSLETINPGNSIATVILAINENLENKLEEYKIIAGTNLGELNKNAILQMLDATGVVLSSYVYENITIQQVVFLNSLSYDDDGILTAQIHFRHEPRKKMS